MKKIKKIRDIEPKIKKVAESHRDDSDLENEIGDSTMENFGEFMTSSSRAIVPILENSQEVQDIPEETPAASQPSRVTDTRSLYQSSSSDYLSSDSEGSRPYISQTSSTSVTASIKPDRIIQNTQAQDTDILQERSPQEERREKYQSELERSSSKEKSKYEWE